MALDRRRMTGSYLPLREAMDRLFEGSFISPQAMGGQGGFPAANLEVTDDDVIIEMAVPGVNPDDINISVTGDTVTISGEVKRDRQQRKGQRYLEEIFEGSFQRSFVLPFPVDADKATANFENGTLRLTLPKSEAAKPRKIQVAGQRSLQGQTQQQGMAQQQDQIQKEQVPASGSRTT
ncbi:MAG TPA: Hsp20/alpha crystallin family protein [Chloroflexota bacterium]